MDELKPFEIISETEIYNDANRFVVLEAHLKTPNEKEVDWTYIKSKDGVVVIPVDGENKVYLKREWRLSRKAFVWELPSGWVEPADPSLKEVEEAAGRELQEEIGRKAGKLIHLTTYYPFNYLSGKFHLYLARDLIESKLPRDEHEYLEVKKLPFEEAFKLLTQDQIPTAQILLAFSLAREKLKIT